MKNTQAQTFRRLLPMLGRLTSVRERQPVAALSSSGASTRDASEEKDSDAPDLEAAAARPRLFAMTSFHATNLVVHEATHQIACAVRGAETTGCRRLVGFEVEALPGSLFLVADDAAFSIGLQAQHFRNPVLCFNVTRRDDGFVTMHDPLTGRYLSGPPLRSGEQVGFVTASRDHAQAWERFQLQAEDEEDVPAAVHEAAQTVALLAGYGVHVSGILAFIAKAPGRHKTTALNAVLPLLGVADLTAISDRLLSRTGLIEHLAEQSSDDVWAREALPALQRWLQQREHRSITARQTGSLLIGPELDILHRPGAEGHLLSFAQACTSFARRAVTPKRNACVVMTARNEGIYLLEWLAHHRALGFEGFFIYSNNNVDDSDLLLAALSDAGHITWIRNEITGKISAQGKALGHAFGMCPDVLDYEWSLVCDADEFFVTNRERFRTVTDFMAWQSKRDVDAVALNWHFIGSNNRVDCLDERLTRRNTRHVHIANIGDGHRLIKSIFRPRVMVSARAHTPVCNERSSFVYRLATGDLHQYRHNPGSYFADPGFSDLINTENACIHHFFFKSAEEWLWKTSRNRGDGRLSTGVDFGMLTDAWIRNFMLQNDAPDDPFVDHLAPFGQDVQRELSRLMAEPAIETAYRQVRQSFSERLADLKTQVRASSVIEGLNETSREFLKLAGVLH